MNGGKIDWEAVHGRLALAAAALSGEVATDSEQARRILEARRKRAAVPPAQPDEAEKLAVLAFSISGESYGVEIRYVREVCRLRELTPIPCTPGFVAGAVILRGRVLVVIDLRSYFELPSAGLTELNQIIVLGDDADEFGLLADSIDGTRLIAAAELRENLPTLAGARGMFIRGITGQMLAVLDGHRLLKDESLKSQGHANR